MGLMKLFDGLQNFYAVVKRKMLQSLPDGGVGERPGQGLGGDRGQVAGVGSGGDQARGDKRKKVLWLPLIGSLPDFGTTTIMAIFLRSSHCK